MWGRFRRKEQDISALQKVLGRFRRSTSARREEVVYGSARRLGFVVLLILVTGSLAFWLLGGRSSAFRGRGGGGTTWCSKRRRYRIKGGSPSGRGTPRKARDNAYNATNSPRGTAPGRGAPWKTLKASYSIHPAAEKRNSRKLSCRLRGFSETATLFLTP